MALRRGHGTGAGAPRIEVLPPVELPSATPGLPARPDRDASGRFVKGNGVAQSKRLKPGPNGLLRLDQSKPEFKPFALWGRRYASHRRRELAEAHGGKISAGVGAIVESAALAMAASRYLDHQARQSGSADLFKQAAQLGQTARQHELAAWELAAREAEAARRRPGLVPWFDAEPAGSPANAPTSTDDSEPHATDASAQSGQPEGEENEP